MNTSETKIIIAGDFIPCDNNMELFKHDDASHIFGSEICHLFASADFSIVNLEGTLTNSQEKQTKIGPAIKAEKETIKGIKALGVTAVAMANNHVTDYGEQGILDTFEVLEANGISHVGAGRNISDINTHLSLLNSRICIYNVSEQFFNSPSETTPGVNLYDEYVVCNEIRELKKYHEYVIVIYHGGAELFPYPTPLTRKRFHRMADCGADIVTAQHTHCIGCEEWYKGSYLLYGQGNFLFSRQATRPMNMEGLVLEVILDNGLIIKKHRVELNKEACLQYSSDQSLIDFYNRSKEIDDSEMILKKYTKLKSDNIIERYLLAYKGNCFWLKKFKRFIPNQMYKRLLYSYSSGDILRNRFTLLSERANEDIYYMWQQILDNKSF